VAYFLGQFVYDKGDEARLAARPSHRDYLRDLLSQGKVVLAGAMADETHGTILYRADSLEEVTELMANDPYTLKQGATAQPAREWNIVIHEETFS